MNREAELRASIPRCLQRFVRRLVEQAQEVTCGTNARFFLSMMFLIIILILILKFL